MTRKQAPATPRAGRKGKRAAANVDSDEDLPKRQDSSTEDDSEDESEGRRQSDSDEDDD